MIAAEELLKGLKNSLVTGATGFIGSNLVEVLSEKGVMVRVLFRKGSNIKLLDGLAVEGYPGDLFDKEVLAEAISDSTTVYNIAADTRELLPYMDYERVNVDGLKNLLEVSRSKKAQKVIHLSSAEVYGTNLPSYAIKEDYPTHPKNPFQKSKEAGDRLALEYHKANPDLNITVVRPPIAIGPRDKAFSEVLLDMIHEGKVTIPGNGRGQISFVYVKDLALALHLIANSGETTGEIFHVKSFDTTPIDLIEALGNAANLKPTIRTARPAVVNLAKAISKYSRKVNYGKPSYPGSKVGLLAGSRIIDDSRLRALGYRPAYTLEKAAEELVAWYKKRKRPSR